MSLPEGFAWSSMVPELMVTDLAVSLRFWCGLCGFRVAYARPEDGFAYLDRAGPQVMLEEAFRPGCRRWMTGALERPFGRGLNLQVTVEDVGPILAALGSAGWPLFVAEEKVWYRADDRETGVRQFVVQDPDGYLVRFSQRLGLREAR
jgi:catechol 2,3-dioxygenase-like lactoylglutathione lyase family enzyme